MKININMNKPNSKFVYETIDFIGKLTYKQLFEERNKKATEITRNIAS